MTILDIFGYGFFIYEVLYTLGCAIKLLINLGLSYLSFKLFI